VSTVFFVFLFIASHLFYDVLQPVVSKKRTPPDFTWMNAYQPKETADPAAVQQQGADNVSTVLKSNDDAGESEVDAAHHRLGGQPKMDSNLSSPDVAVHRSSIATGK
jgi:hypothetical protein